ncbi:MAG: hypothetical protein AAF628_34185 [Planctomycetota bacterium]
MPTTRSVPTLVVIALAACSNLTAQGLILPPPDLNPGDQYRVLFVTDSTRDATSTEVADYDAFVTADADAVPTLAALGTTWQAVVSTESIHALAHTAATPPFAGPVPVYRPDGARVADDSTGGRSHLWGTITGAPLSAPVRMTASGQDAGDAWVWTGSTGAGRADWPLGDTSRPNATIGRTLQTTNRWLRTTNLPQTRSLRLFGLSGILIVPLDSAESTRLGSPANPQAFLPGTISGPVIGQTWDPRIDHTSFLPGAVADFAIFSSAPTNQSLGSLGTLLCDLTGHVVLGTAGPGVPFGVSFPFDNAFVGATMCVQGGSLDASSVFLANALDVTIGTR